MNSSAYIATFGRSAFIGVFPATSGDSFPYSHDCPVVLQTERGLEIGRIVGKSDRPAAPHRTLIRSMDEADRMTLTQLREREARLYPVLCEWLSTALPERPLLDIELLFDGQTLLLHGFWEEQEIQESLIADFTARCSLKPLFYDTRSEWLVEPAPKTESGCGKTDCGTGSCSSCGDGKSGCSSGSCSRGSFKKPDELKNYLLDLREKMENAGRVSLR